MNTNENPAEAGTRRQRRGASGRGARRNQTVPGHAGVAPSYDRQPVPVPQGNAAVDQADLVATPAAVMEEDQLDLVGSPESSSPVSQRDDVADQANSDASAADIQEDPLVDSSASHVSDRDDAVDEADLVAESVDMQKNELHIFSSPTASPVSEMDDVVDEAVSVEPAALEEDNDADVQKLEPELTNIYENPKSPFRHALRVANNRGVRAAPAERLYSPFLINHTVQYTEQQNAAIIKINSLVTLAEGRNNQAAQDIAACLIGVIKRADLSFSVDDRETLTDNLRTLQFTSKSLFNTAINAVIATVLCCSLVGVLALWLTGAFDKKKTVNGSPFAFFAFGEKQQVEKTIHEAELILQAPLMS